MNAKCQQQRKGTNQTTKHDSVVYHYTYTYIYIEKSTHSHKHASLSEWNHDTCIDFNACHPMYGVLHEMSQYFAGKPLGCGWLKPPYVLSLGPAPGG